MTPNHLLHEVQTIINFNQLPLVIIWLHNGCPFLQGCIFLGRISGPPKAFIKSIASGVKKGGQDALSKPKKRLYLKLGPQNGGCSRVSCSGYGTPKFKFRGGPKRALDYNWVPDFNGSYKRQSRIK